MIVKKVFFLYITKFPEKCLFRCVFIAANVRIENPSEKNARKQCRRFKEEPTSCVNVDQSQPNICTFTWNFENSKKKYWKNFTSQINFVLILPANKIRLTFRVMATIQRFNANTASAVVSAPHTAANRTKKSGAHR